MPVDRLQLCRGGGCKPSIVLDPPPKKWIEASAEFPPRAELRLPGEFSSSLIVDRMFFSNAAELTAGWNPTRIIDGFRVLFLTKRGRKQ